MRYLLILILFTTTTVSNLYAQDEYPEYRITLEELEARERNAKIQVQKLKKGQLIVQYSTFRGKIADLKAFLETTAQPEKIQRLLDETIAERDAKYDALLKKFSSDFNFCKVYFLADSVKGPIVNVLDQNNEEQQIDISQDNTFFARLESPPRGTFYQIESIVIRNYKFNKIDRPFPFVTYGRLWDFLFNKRKINVDLIERAIPRLDKKLNKFYQKEISN